VGYNFYSETNNRLLYRLLYLQNEAIKHIGGIYRKNSKHYKNMTWLFSLDIQMPSVISLSVLWKISLFFNTVCLQNFMFMFSLKTTGASKTGTCVFGFWCEHWVLLVATQLWRLTFPEIDQKCDQHELYLLTPQAGIEIRIHELFHINKLYAQSNPVPQDYTETQNK